MKVWAHSQFVLTGHMSDRVEDQLEPCSRPCLRSCPSTPAVQSACKNIYTFFRIRSFSYYITGSHSAPVMQWIRGRHKIFHSCRNYYTSRMASLSIVSILANLTGIGTGTEYDQLSILNPDFTLNEEKLAVQVLKEILSLILEQMSTSSWQGLPWYAASQLLFKVSRTMYIGGTSILYPTS